MMKLRPTLVWTCLLSLAVAGLLACLPTPPSESGGVPITLYGFSIMKEVMEKQIYPDFSAKWKEEHGEEVRFTSSFAGSETITNQILQGVSAEIAVVAIERDAFRLQAGGATTTDWRQYPHGGIINKTPIIIIVRKGNPKGIHDFEDLSKPGIKLIHPDPFSSGGAQWSILAIYGSQLIKSEARTGGERDEAAALQTLRAIWRNVSSTPGSAREARTQFETGYGDALITYEQDALLMRRARSDIEIVVPESTIFSEHPVVSIDRNIKSTKQAIIKAFISYLWSDEAQQSFVKGGLRSVTNEEFNQANPEFANIRKPFTVEYFGGWEKAYPDIIEKVWRDKVQRK